MCLFLPQLGAGLKPTRSLSAISCSEQFRCPRFRDLDIHLAALATLNLDLQLQRVGILVLQTPGYRVSRPCHVTQLPCSPCQFYGDRSVLHEYSFGLIERSGSPLLPACAKQGLKAFVAAKLGARVVSGFTRLLICGSHGSMATSTSSPRR